MTARHQSENRLCHVSSAAVFHTPPAPPLLSFPVWFYCVISVCLIKYGVGTGASSLVNRGLGTGEPNDDIQRWTRLKINVPRAPYYGSFTLLTQIAALCTVMSLLPELELQRRPCVLWDGGKTPSLFGTGAALSYPVQRNEETRSDPNMGAWLLHVKPEIAKHFWFQVQPEIARPPL